MLLKSQWTWQKLKNDTFENNQRYVLRDVTQISIYFTSITFYYD